MFDSESKLGFFQTIVGQLAALTKSANGNEISAAESPIEVSLQTLEDRVLYSAVPVPVDLVSSVDLIDTVIDTALEDTFPAMPDQTQMLLPAVDQGRIFDAEPLELVDPSEVVVTEDHTPLDNELSSEDIADADNDLLLTESVSSRVTNELVVVDRGVEGYQQLVDDLIASETSDRRFEIIYLDTDSSGIESLTRQLSERVADGAEPYDALHLISHGTDGNIQLGSDQLNSGNLSQFEDSVSQWGFALAIDADLLIYGCDVASSESGMDFIDSLASLTGADVAASDDVTGHRELGGDWDFEYTVGLVGSDIAFSQTVQQNWDHSLETVVTTSESGGQSQSIGIDGRGRTFTVTSVEDGANTDGFDVRLQFIDTSGNTTTEIVVNETLAGDQVYASLAVADNGTKAVTWTSISTTGERAVFAKVYDANNNVVRSEFRVDVQTRGVEADDSSIAIDAAGNFVIVWESVEAGVSEIVGQRFNADGNADGLAFNVSGSGYRGFEEAANAFVASNDAGQFVVVWDTHDGTINDRSDIHARTFNPDGTGSGRIRIQEGDQLTQAVADIDSRGNYVVAYSVNDLNSDQWDVRVEVNRFDGTFITATDDFVTTTDGNQFGPSVAFLESGVVAIAWESQMVDDLGMPVSQDIFGASIEFDTGDVVFPQEQLGSSLPSMDRQTGISLIARDDISAAGAFISGSSTSDILIVGNNPDSVDNVSPTGQDTTIALTDDGRRTINAADFSFQDIDGDLFTQVQISRTAQNGRLLLDGREISDGEVVLVSQILAGELVYEPDSNFSGQDTVQFLVHDGISFADSFSTLTLEVPPTVEGFVPSFGTSYTSVSGGIPVNTSIIGTQANPEIVALDRGGYVVVWEGPDNDLTSDDDGDGNPDDGRQVYLQQFDDANNRVGSEIVVGGTLGEDQTNPSVISLTDGNIVVAFVDQEPSTSVRPDIASVHAQRFNLDGDVLFDDGSVDPTGTYTITLEQAGISIFPRQRDVSLTALSNGGFIASWTTSESTLGGFFGFGSDSVARVFNADGTPSTDDFLLNEPDSLYCWNTRLCSASDFAW